jgi:hypothetical protein
VAQPVSHALAPAQQLAGKWRSCCRHSSGNAERPSRQQQPGLGEKQSMPVDNDVDDQQSDVRMVRLQRDEEDGCVK